MDRRCIRTSGQTVRSGRWLGGATPTEAWSQADDVFATENIADRHVSARALNSCPDA